MFCDSRRVSTKRTPECVPSARHNLPYPRLTIVRETCHCYHLHINIQRLRRPCHVFLWRREHIWTPGNRRSTASSSGSESTVLQSLKRCAHSTTILEIYRLNVFHRYRRALASDHAQPVVYVDTIPQRNNFSGIRHHRKRKRVQRDRSLASVQSNSHRACLVGNV